jgi:hypothetical protein
MDITVALEVHHQLLELLLPAQVAVAAVLCAVIWADWAVQAGVE